MSPEEIDASNLRFEGQRHVRAEAKARRFDEMTATLNIIVIEAMELVKAKKVTATTARKWAASVALRLDAAVKP